MTLVRPSAVVTLNGKRLTSAEGAITRVRVRLGLGPKHDAVDIFCWPSSKLKDASLGAKATVALGSLGSESDVWTGEISGVRLTPDGVALEALAATIALSRTYMSQIFVSVSVSDIVNQLAAKAGVDVDNATGDLSFPAYAVDDRRSVWSHVNDLAKLIGADVSATEAGKLKFVAPTSSSGGALGGLANAVSSTVSNTLLGGGTTGLRYGANVLDWRMTTRTIQDAPAVQPFGAASEDGSEKWHWIRAIADLEKQVQEISAAARTQDGATAFSDALTVRAKRASRRAAVAVVGDASLRPGQKTQISGIPGDGGGDLRIVAVEHLLDNDAGFISRLTVEIAA
jgi:hypothetical protein